MTSKLQVTVPKALAERYGIRPGDDIRFEEAGEVMRVVPASADAPREGLDIEARLRLFDAATERQRKRDDGRRADRASTRGWTREELYERGHADAD
ncbi:MAG: AbrB/MazE/SpoVT family DNA-binding domain-containing protein [bacterium]|nr:AbrB/MazE/SpoVT family DNA-binding domain-containing protein [bacterium]MDE0415964.1 AbrB/MazE/SpoVT family DNA-binding domain-containing protein [bacterium]